MGQVLAWRSQSRLLDEVAQALRERIYAGVYAPGATLRQERIAAEFGISRTPLREAFRVLERDGLVVNKPGSGVRVATADLPKLLEKHPELWLVGEKVPALADISVEPVKQVDDLVLFRVRRHP